MFFLHLSSKNAKYINWDNEEKLHKKLIQGKNIIKQEKIYASVNSWTGVFSHSQYISTPSIIFPFCHEMRQWKVGLFFYWNIFWFVDFCPIIISMSILHGQFYFFIFIFVFLIFSTSFGDTARWKLTFRAETESINDVAWYKFTRYASQNHIMWNGNI